MIQPFSTLSSPFSYLILYSSTHLDIDTSQTSNNNNNFLNNT